jgi:hypothetical protein
MLGRLLPCVAVLLVLGALAPHAGRAAELPVVIVRGLGLDDLERLHDRGAVGLLVPDAGPKTSEARARASLVRGEVVNFLRGQLPSGRPMIGVSTVDAVPDGPAIVLALPRGGEQPNDRRYPIAVIGPGYRGLLVSDSTRIPGLVSIVDVAPTALGAGGALRSREEPDAVEELRDLDTRIFDNGDARLPASLLAAVLIVLLALARPRAALLAFATGLGANLLLGLAGVSSPWLTIPAIGAAVLAAWPLAPIVRSPLAVGLALAGTLAAYFATLGLDQPAVALSPFGPTQNARFYGISNLLETMLLPASLGAGALLARRLGLSALAAVAAVALVAVAGSRFGADGGGAIVLVAGFATLAVALEGAGRRSLAVGAGAAGCAVVLVAVDAVLGPTTHVGRSIRGGPGEIAGDLADRVELSWERATSSWGAGLLFAVALILLVSRVARIRSVPTPDARALLVAYAVALAVSLVVNDSPGDIAASGLVGYLALERFPLLRGG